VNVLISEVSFGGITIRGKRYEHDVVVFPSGKVIKRRKEISKRVHGTSHKLDREEIELYLSEEDFEVLVVGKGIYGALSLHDNAKEILVGKEVIELRTEEAARVFNEMRAKRKVLGIFHVTC